MKLKLSIVIVCMFIIHAAAFPQLDVEYDNSTEDENEEKPEIDSELPVMVDSNDDGLLGHSEEEVLPTCTRLDKVYKDQEIFHLGEEDCEVCHCVNGKTECNTDECTANEDLKDSEETMIDVEHVEDGVKDEIKEDEVKVEDVEDDVLEVKEDEDKEDEVKDASEEEIATEPEFEIVTEPETDSIEIQHKSSEHVDENKHQQSSEVVDENHQLQSAEKVDEDQHHQSAEREEEDQHHQSAEKVDEDQHHQSAERVEENQHHQSTENAEEDEHHQRAEHVEEDQHHQRAEHVEEDQHHQSAEKVDENHYVQDFYQQFINYQPKSPVIGAHSIQIQGNSNIYDDYEEAGNEVDYDEPEVQHSLPNYYDLPGQYCAKKFPRSANGKCCDDRLDSCSVPIRSTLCYCDEFCDKHNNPDCCPDYQSHCKGAPSNIEISCEVDGVYFKPFDPPQMINCNSCKCQQNGQALCTIDSCLSNTEMIHNINNAHDISWTAKNYSEFYGRKYNEGLELRLGTFEPVRKVKTMSRLSNGQKQLPSRFNSLERWPGLISDVRDQGWCGSSWAISTASVASDRFSVKSNGQEMVDMAPQQLLSCAKRQQGCTGGHLDIAWNYFRRWGGVDEDCYPYVAKVNTCRVPDKRQSTLRSLGCAMPTKVARTSLYKMGPAYSLNDESDIMSEIFNHGPVQATMRVYHDFFTYQTGVYSHSPFGADQRSGFHSVRLIGWGQEDNGYENLKYWIAANSWGKWWGEKGFFRILRGNNECEIENYVLSSLADIQDTKVNVRRGRNPRHHRQ